MADVFKIKKQEAPYYLCDICGKIRFIKSRNEILCEFTDEMIDESDNTRRYRNIDSLQVCNDCLLEATNEKVIEENK
jgi:hypothetical protein